MSMPLYEIMPVVALLLCVAFLVYTVWASSSPGLWPFPALLSLGFALWTFHAVSVEGLTGFWAEHVRNAWSNQIWFDLLIGLATAWTLLLPRARAAGMPVLLWLLIILCTGGIGLMAMVARCLFLEGRMKHGTPNP